MLSVQWYTLQEGPTEVGLTEIDWRKTLFAWMHGPVDKAFWGDHEVRAAHYIECALGEKVDYREVKAALSTADDEAAMAGRIPMPSGGRAVGPQDGHIEIRHSVSASPSTLERLALNKRVVADVIGNIVSGLEAHPRLRFLALWRLLPERLAEALGPDFVRLPADTRVPDHTLFQHADITAGLATAMQQSREYGYLSVALGPVQTFIEASRSVRDLWSGSVMLSWLIFQGIRRILEQLGPTALVFPTLRASPLVDLWLRNACGLEQVEMPARRSLRAPALPNRFLALVPWGSEGRSARMMADACRHAIEDGWQRLAAAVHHRAGSVLKRLDRHWDRRWDAQVGSFFNVTTSILPCYRNRDDQLASFFGRERSFAEIWPEAHQVRGMADSIRPEDRCSFFQKGSGRWQANLELSARMMEAQRTIRPVPNLNEEVPSPPKCSLLGSYEQMGPSELGASAKFWGQAAQARQLRLKQRERLCAIALCKRLATDAFLQKELGLGTEAVSVPDTATVAARLWLHGASIDTTDGWNGRWLHQKSRGDVELAEEKPPSQNVWIRITQARKKHGYAPAYYAVLMLDADDMGSWLKGDKAPTVEEVLHPKLVDYYKSVAAKCLLEARRPVGPAQHAAISEALNMFASHIAPGIVESEGFCGTMIYSGGDDLLALLPAREAIKCAHRLQEAFRGIPGYYPGWTKIGARRVVTMGRKATLSAGIAFVHYKYDLRAAIADARETEKNSKEKGRNRLTLRFVRRSGERPEIGLNWELAPWLQRAVDAFAGGASDRWVYHLRREQQTLQALPPDAVGSEVRRIVSRSAEYAHEDIDFAKWWDNFCSVMDSKDASVADFTRLCLGAAFVART